MSIRDQVAVTPGPAAALPPVSVDRPATVARDEHVTPGERAARGKAARREVPRSAHAEWEPAPQRSDPIDLLEEQALLREPELVPIRYGRMLVSPFAFFRGGAYLMAADLAGRPHTELRAQLCGDAHLSNFGYFAAPDRRLVFSVNDFDETLRGPFEWDVKRLVASLAVAGRDRGFAPAERRPILTAAVRAYRDAMREFARMRKLDVWYARMDVEALRARFRAAATSARRKQFEHHVARAGAKDSLRAFAKLTTVVDGTPRIVADPPLIVPIEHVPGQVHADELEAWIQGVIRSYRRTLSGERRRLMEGFRYVHAARKVVGVGSVGTRAWIVLMLGRDGEDPLFLQFKEAQASVLEPFLGRCEYATHGQRVVEGQRLIQAASDILLGWNRVTGIDGLERDFYVRQLWDGKGSPVVELMQPGVMALYGQACAWTLARAHARSGDPIAISSYVGSGESFVRALATFAESYADQSERDHAALQQAVAAGRIEATIGL